MWEGGGGGGGCMLHVCNSEAYSLIPLLATIFALSETMTATVCACVKDILNLYVDALPCHSSSCPPTKPSLWKKTKGECLQADVLVKAN